MHRRRSAQASAGPRLPPEPGHRPLAGAGDLGGQPGRCRVSQPTEGAPRRTRRRRFSTAVAMRRSSRPVAWRSSVHGMSMTRWSSTPRASAGSRPRRGCTVVSGGARGIDQAAMRGALEAGGKAVGVLADSLERTAVAREYREALTGGPTRPDLAVRSRAQASTSATPCSATS